MLNVVLCQIAHVLPVCRWLVNMARISMRSRYVHTFNDKCPSSYLPVVDREENLVDNRACATQMMGDVELGRRCWDRGNKKRSVSSSGSGDTRLCLYCACLWRRRWKAGEQRHWDPFRQCLEHRQAHFVLLGPQVVHNAPHTSWGSLAAEGFMENIMYGPITAQSVPREDCDDHEYGLHLFVKARLPLGLH